MLKIAICDPCEDYRKQTENILFHMMFDVEDLTFAHYAAGISLEEEIEKGVFHQDLLVMEPCLPDDNGIRLLELLRSSGQQTDIILQTEQLELAVYGYRYHVFDFIAKPTSIKEAERVFNRYISERISGINDSAFLPVSIQGCRYRIRLWNVLFFESSGRKVRAIMDRDNVEFYQKMDDLQDMLNPTRFIRCHQSYIINLEHVLGITASEIILYGKKKIPVSRRYLPLVQERMKEYLQRGSVR